MLYFALSNASIALRGPVVRCRCAVLTPPLQSLSHELACATAMSQVTPQHTPTRSLQPSHRAYTRLLRMVVGCCPPLTLQRRRGGFMRIVCCSSSDAKCGLLPRLWMISCMQPRLLAVSRCNSLRRFLFAGHMSSSSAAADAWVGARWNESMAGAASCEHLTSNVLSRYNSGAHAAQKI